MMDYDIRKGRTYMYFKGEPLYPFGFGLSYTTFKYSSLKTSANSLSKDGSLTVRVDLKNTGKRAGEEVVQLYVARAGSSSPAPIRELRGFQRVSLQPHERKTVELALSAKSLGRWDEHRHAFTIEPGKLELQAGEFLGGYSPQENRRCDQLMNLKFALTVLALALFAGCKTSDSVNSTAALSSGRVSVQSPDRTIEFTLRGNGPLTYSVSVDGKPVLSESRLGLKFRDGLTLGANAQLVKVQRSESNTTWENKLGKRRIVRDHHHELRASFVEESGRPFEIVVRIYNDGLGFRYVLPAAPSAATQDFILEEDQTEFSFPENYFCYAGINENTGKPENPIGYIGSQESEFNRGQLSDRRRHADRREHPAARPVDRAQHLHPAPAGARLLRLRAEAGHRPVHLDGKLKDYVVGVTGTRLQQPVGAQQSNWQNSTHHLHPRVRVRGRPANQTVCSGSAVLHLGLPRRGQRLSAGSAALPGDVRQDPGHPAAYLLR